jgi:hypothetical protein
MHETLPSLIERALSGNQRPLEFYLRDQSRLPGPRANLELLADVCDELVMCMPQRSEEVRALLRYLTREEKTVASNTPEEFIVTCGVAALGASATTDPGWRKEVYMLLRGFARSTSWRVREGVVIALQYLLITTAQQETLTFLLGLAETGTYLQQRACVAAVAEPRLLATSDMQESALAIQQIVLRRVREVAQSERKRDDFRTLRQALGYTLSVVVAALPEPGFALMRECASWNDSDIAWILRENMKKKRLARFNDYMEQLRVLLAG